MPQSTRTSPSGMISLADLEPLVVLTGAGISAESGVPTFRGEGGIWQSHRAEDLATPFAFERNPELVWEFYNWRRNLIAQCSPNPGHLTLAQMEIVINDFLLITQNVDGLHHVAGSMNVLEIHGSIWQIKCAICSEIRIYRNTNEASTVPMCQVCGEMMRPDVVWFGEMLDQEKLNQAFQSVARANTMLVIGTSALVQPVNTLPIIAKEAGAKLIEINPNPTPLSHLMDMRLSGPSGKMLPKWWNEVQNVSLNSN